MQLRLAASAFFKSGPAATGFGSSGSTLQGKLHRMVHEKLIMVSFDTNACKKIRSRGFREVRQEASASYDRQLRLFFKAG